jgi:hypothetical protein
LRAADADEMPAPLANVVDAVAAGDFKQVTIEPRISYGSANCFTNTTICTAVTA